MCVGLCVIRTPSTSHQGYGAGHRGLRSSSTAEQGSPWSPVRPHLLHNSWTALLQLRGCGDMQGCREDIHNTRLNRWTDRQTDKFSQFVSLLAVYVATQDCALYQPVSISISSE